jgi:hypothetical protein
VGLGIVQAALFQEEFTQEQSENGILIPSRHGPFQEGNGSCRVFPVARLGAKVQPFGSLRIARLGLEKALAGLGIILMRE